LTHISFKNLRLSDRWIFLKGHWYSQNGKNIALKIFEFLEKYIFLFLILLFYVRDESKSKKGKNTGAPRI
jgi:hypothetical protein